MAYEKSLVGFNVRGRNGTLGIIVAPAAANGVHVSTVSELLVVGGRSSLLRLHIPLSRVARVSREERTVDVDLDVVDFTARIADDGLVDLRVTV